MKRMSLQGWLTRQVFGGEIRRQVRGALAEAETDAVFRLGSRRWLSEARERLDYDREEVLEQALKTWRANPLARRIVELTSQYVVGGGIQISSPHARVHAFLQRWWNHPLNQMPQRVFEWCDELTRSGELFVLLSTDAAGMSYARAVPAAQIDRVETAKNDLQQELAYVQKSENGLDETRWNAYNPAQDNRGADGRFETVMLHYAVNRPAGAVRGESDLAPLLRWLNRYSAWLEDRARLNRYRNAFLYVVKARYASEAERLARQSALNAVPPSPGSILVTDESESWDVIHPRLEADDANADGLALKKMIAAGAGLPMHFLAEPESATRTTAEAAGGPTFRRFQQRQEFFLWLMRDLAGAALRRRARLDRNLSAEAEINVQGADLSGRDNAALAVAAATVIGSFAQLYSHGLIEGAELLRLAYRFAGEKADAAQLISRAHAENGGASKGQAKPEAWNVPAAPDKVPEV